VDLAQVPPAVVKRYHLAAGRCPLGRAADERLTKFQAALDAITAADSLLGGETGDDHDD
jgi:hypothetical protein